MSEAHIAPCARRNWIIWSYDWTRWRRSAFSFLRSDGCSGTGTDLPDTSASSSYATAPLLAVSIAGKLAPLPGGAGIAISADETYARTMDAPRAMLEAALANCSWVRLGGKKHACASAMRFCLASLDMSSGGGAGGAMGTTSEGALPSLAMTSEPAPPWAFTESR